MNYSNDCGCSPAPKAVKTLSVQPTAPTEEIVCPDVRCMPHLLSSLPETDDAVPNYVGVYKGQSYIAPIRALVDSVLADIQNSQYRNGEVPTVTDYRDIESLPVVQKGTCQKTGIAAMPTIAKAMTMALPAAPVGYEPNKVMTTDGNGDVYLATPLQVESPVWIASAIDNCEKGKIVNFPVLSQILGFGAGCKEFGSTTIKQLQEALAKVVPIATPGTLPAYLRGFLNADEERKYPVTVSKQFSGTQNFVVKQPLLVNSQPTPYLMSSFTLQPGLYAVSVIFTGSMTPTGPTGHYFGIYAKLTAGVTRTSVSVSPASPIPNAAAFGSQTVVANVKITAPTVVQIELRSATSQGTALDFDGTAIVDVLQLAELNIAINGVF